jgi:hypothetical protein
MIALRIVHNGTEVCTAGVGQDGMIGMSMHWVRRTGAGAHRARRLILRSRYRIQT